MRRLTLVLLLIILSFPTSIFSQNKDLEFKFDTRFDFDYIRDNIDSTKDNSGINGKYLKLILNGKINDKFSYKFRHRLYLNATDTYRGYFNQTDWAYINYNATERWSFSAGKQVVAIGTYEYDYAPIDIYFWSDFWENIICYQLGISANYTTKKHSLGFQITNSPFAKANLSSTYAYNLIWYGDMDWFKTIYSANMIEYDKGKFVNYIALGNQFNYKNLGFELDYINRTSDKANNHFNNFTLIGNLKYNFKNASFFVKSGYDQNKSQSPDILNPYDIIVKPGTDYRYYGFGAEYYPIKGSKDIRLHAFWSLNNKETNNQNFNIGVRWQMKVLDI